MVVSNVQMYSIFHLTPQARMDDGLLDVFLFKGLGGFLYMLRMAGQLFVGRHLQNPQVVQRTARQVTVWTEMPMAVQADGEPWGPRRSASGWSPVAAGDGAHPGPFYSIQPGGAVKALYGLLILVPVALLSRYLGGPAVLTFGAAALGIVPLAAAGPRRRRRWQSGPGLGSAA